MYLEALAYHVNIIHGLGVDQVEVETEPLTKLALALTQHPMQFPKDLNESGRPAQFKRVERYTCSW